MLTKLPSPVLQFASKLHTQLATSQENLFYSPFSLLSALGMCLAGAKGRTRTNLTKLLEVSTDAVEQKAYFKALTAEVNSGEEKPYELVTANALWAKKGLAFDKDYAALITEDYHGAFREVDYVNAPDKAVEEINEWCNENTKGKIPQIIGRNSVNDDTILVLTNAIYFLGKWLSQFNEANTHADSFRTPTGEKQVQTMHISGRFAYSETPEFQALDLPYVGNELSMLIVLPKGDSTQLLDESLEAVYTKAFEDLQLEKKVVISLPKFKLETDYKLSGILNNLGAAVAFSDEANFSGITTEERLKISQVVHKAFVKCDEEGTEAAAATAVSMTRLCNFTPVEEKVFDADHPFLFFIRNKKSGNVLFCGRVADPS